MTSRDLHISRVAAILDAARRRLAAGWRNDNPEPCPGGPYCVPCLLIAVCGEPEVMEVPEALTVLSAIAVCGRIEAQEGVRRYEDPTTAYRVLEQAAAGAWGAVVIPWGDLLGGLGVFVALAATVYFAMIAFSKLFPEDHP